MSFLESQQKMLFNPSHNNAVDESHALSKTIFENISKFKHEEYQYLQLI